MSRQHAKNLNFGIAYGVYGDMDPHKREHAHLIAGDEVWWCTMCGNRWANGIYGQHCYHPGAALERFPYQDAVRAAYEIGGVQAVWDMEQTLFTERLYLRDL